MVAALLAVQQSAEKVNAVEVKSKSELANTLYNQNKVADEEDSLVELDSESEASDSDSSADSKSTKKSIKTGQKATKKLLSKSVKSIVKSTKVDSCYCPCMASYKK